MNDRGKFRPVWLERSIILDRRSWVFYLVLNESSARKWAEQIKVQPDERFYEVLGEHVQAYVEKGAEPPEMIASAVMNIADDFMSERDLVIRAGDYIAVQNFIRQQGSPA